MVYSTSLEQLKLNFSNAICSFGCCRDFDMQLQYLSLLQLKIIRMLDLMTGEEKVEKLIWDAMIPPGGEAPEALKVEINPEQDPWAKWKDAKIEETEKQEDRWGCNDCRWSHT